MCMDGCSWNPCGTQLHLCFCSSLSEASTAALLPALPPEEQSTAANRSAHLDSKAVKDICEARRALAIEAPRVCRLCLRAGCIRGAPILPHHYPPALRSLSFQCMQSGLSLLPPLTNPHRWLAAAGVAMGVVQYPQSRLSGDILAKAPHAGPKSSTDC